MDTIALCVRLWPRATTNAQRRAILRRLRKLAPPGSAARESWRRAVIAWGSRSG